MEITRSVVSERDRALLGGDYNAYHAQATRRIHALRRRLRTATPKGRKYTPKSPVTAENIAQNIEWVQLLLASSERAWASAMAMKSNQSIENAQKPMAGSTKRQIASRLKRAISYADNLVAVVKDRSTTRATAIDELEAKAYLRLLRGSLNFEKMRWKECIQDYSVVRVVYATLAATSKTEIYKDLLSGIVDPSIRYAAYQLKMPRTKPLPEIVIEHFPSSEEQTKEELKKIDQSVFEVGAAAAAVDNDGPKDLPSFIAWRSRRVNIEDAAISQALGITKEREEALSRIFETFKKGTVAREDLAAAYDDVITARQDATDATKTAIDELVTEGVDPGDPRMQSLQITRTAVNYAVIEWRIGRNRVLCGSDDGLVFEAERQKQSPKPRKDGQPRVAKEESSGRKISRLRERTALYDSILQSLDSVKELPGVIADTAFVAEVDAKRAYFRALKCLAIGRSHAVNGSIHNALALYARASSLAQDAAAQLQDSTAISSDPAPKLDVTTSHLSEATGYLTRLVSQYRALAELKNLSTTPTSSTKDEVHKRPFIESLHLNNYDDNVDLENLVNYPPKLQPIPVKPIFFDLAWNYIQYPGRGKEAKGAVSAAATAQPAKEEAKTKSKGWFGFGR